MRGPFALSFGGIDSEERTPEASRILAGGANHRFRPRNAASPGRGDGMVGARFPQPRRGSDSIFTTNRWFAPPANVQCPSGTTPLLQPQNAELRSNTNS